jgi:GxxExxY protein
LFEDLSSALLRAAIEVHRELGPGLLESVYEQCLSLELAERGIAFQRQWPLTFFYRNQPFDCGYRIDFLIEDKIIVELKAIESLAPVHEAQLLTYLRLSRKQVGFLINFNAYRLMQGVRRFVL